MKMILTITKSENYYHSHQIFPLMKLSTFSKLFGKAFSLQNSQILASISAIALHGGIALWSVWPSNPTLISTQTIQVSFVAPSSTKQVNENVSHKKLDFKKDNGLKQSQKNQAEVKSQQIAEERKTSGRIDEKAVAEKSAETDPVFDAAYLNNPAPIYPAGAKRRGIQGKVLLDVLVKIDGSAASVTIARSSGSSQLDEAALDAVRDWKFIPAKRSGKIVQANVIVPVEFKII